MSRITGNLQILGALSCRSITLPGAPVANSQVQALAGIEASKLEHQHQPVYAQSGEAADDEAVVHVVSGASGTVLSVRAGCAEAATGDSEVSVDLLKNGASILSSPLMLTASQSAYELVAGSIDSGSVESEDVLSVALSTNAGTGTLPEGVFVSLVIREDAQ